MTWTSMARNVSLAALIVAWAGCEPKQAPAARDATLRDDAGAPATASSRPASSATAQDLRALALEVERRGLATFGPNGLADAFAVSGNVVVSAFSAGLTTIVGEASLASNPSSYERFAALTHTAAACFGVVQLSHRVVLAPGTSTHKEAIGVTSLLSPGHHMGREEPASSLACAHAYSPLSLLDHAPTIADLVPASERTKTTPSMSGARLARSLTTGLPNFAQCGRTSAEFRACGEPEPQPIDLAKAARPDDPPNGIRVRARGHIDSSRDATVLTLPVDLLGKGERASRKQTLVLVLPATSCDGSMERLAPSLAETARGAAASPKNTELSVVLPDIATAFDVEAKAPAPLDGLLLTTKMYSPMCSVPASAPIPSNVTRVALNRPFLYAIVDDDTGAVLLLGRYSQREHAARAHGASGGGGGGDVKTP